MDTLKGIVSKANGVRFANNDGLLPSFDNTLSFNEIHSNLPVVIFDQIYFVANTYLIQFKVGLTATPVLKKIVDGGSTSTIAETTITVYGDFRIFEYLIVLSVEERFYYTLSTQESSWISECQRTIVEDTVNYKRLNWSNLDPENNSYEFDYTTTLAKANTNFMWIKARMLLAPYSGETTIYDNQNEQVVLKENIYRNFSFTSEVIPTTIYEVIIIAMRHDLFEINEVSYIVPEIPELNPFGAAVELPAEVRTVNSLGMNTDDQGYDCDSSTAMREVRNIIFTDAVGNSVGIVKIGYSINQVLILVSSGTVTFKLGNSNGGDEIVKEKTGLTASMGMITMNVTNMPTNGFAFDRDIYMGLSGGVATVWVQTIISTQ